MKHKITLASFFFFCSFLSFAQFSPVGHLNIFSENGDKFFLVLNGEQQNDVPQTNIRIEDLNQPYYNAQIVFADKSLQQVSKNNLTLTDADGVFQDVTYKIKRDKNKKRQDEDELLLHDSRTSRFYRAQKCLCDALRTTATQSGR